MKLKIGLLFIGLTALGFIGLPSSIAQYTDTEAFDDVSQNIMTQDNLAAIVPAQEMDSAPFGFHNWRGFALNDHTSYILRISIERLRPLGLMGARRLLVSNMTIEEIKREISVKEGNVTYVGHIKVGETAYWLVNIKMIPDSDNLTPNADIADPKESLTHEIIARIVGHITINITNQEDNIKGNGELVMTDGLQIGRYHLTLCLDHKCPGHGPDGMLER
jgi:hypothetical protein